MEEGLSCHDLRLVRSTPEGEERVILDGVDAAFPRGTLSLITGPIGAGKTSLLHILSTLLRPTAGEVIADGEAISRYTSSHRDLWRRRVGFAFQTPHVLAELSVLENVMVPMIPTAPSLAAARDAAFAELERLGVASLATRRVAGLSGGERQRVILARALAHRPAFVFADEPTAHQYPAGAALLLERLAQARDDGAVVVIVSHDEAVRTSALVDAQWNLDAGALEAVT